MASSRALEGNTHAHDCTYIASKATVESGRLHVSPACPRVVVRFPGKKLRDFTPLSEGCSFADLAFANVGPSELPDHDVDLWVLALPNNLAKPFVEALDQAQRSDTRTHTCEHHARTGQRQALPPCA